MNKYYKMIDQMHMPKEQYEQLKEELSRQTGKQRSVIPIWRRYAVAAALALCLIGTTATVYAAVHNQWFQMFFDNAGQEAGIVEEITLKASTKTVAVQDENYKFTVINHVYSKDQQMGLILCSFQFLQEQHTHLDIWNRAQEEDVIIKKNGVMPALDFRERNTNKAERPLTFTVCGDSDKMRVATCSRYYLGEKAEDGGYLIGIRYSVSMEDAAEQKLVLFLENAGDINDKLNVVLPESESIECVRFVSEQNPEDFIGISAIGLTFTITDDRANYGYMEGTYDTATLDELKLVMGDQVKAIKDVVGGGVVTGSQKDKTDTTYTWYVQQEFSKLLDVSQVDYIELDGVKYVK